jgi:hypothetical protein
VATVDNAEGWILLGTPPFPRLGIAVQEPDQRHPPAADCCPERIVRYIRTMPSSNPALASSVKTSPVEFASSMDLSRAVGPG